MTPAAVMTYQTAGEALNFHPHLHSCLADGVFYPDGTFQRFAVIDQGALIHEFSDRVLYALRDKSLVSDEDVAQILSQEHSGFNVWLGDPFQDSESDKFVARYIERGPISLEKLSIQDDIITYTTKDEVAHEFDALEFLALLSCHVPKPYESMTRYYGWYSCRARGERKKKLAAQLESQELEPNRQPSLTWAQCIKRVYEINPIECPKCKGNMRIVAFLQDEAEISKIMHHLGIPKFKPPPKLPRAPQQPEIFDDYNSWD